MSWGGFKKAINRAGASVMVKDVDKTMDKDFDTEERRYKTLKTAGTNLQKSAKGYLDSIRQVTNSQVTIAEIISNLYEESKQGESVYSSVGSYYLQSARDFDEETVKQLDGPFRETVLDPIAKFANYFTEIDEAIKKRAHKKTDYEQCKSKVRRLVDKPAKDAAKLPRAEKELSLAKEIYEELNEQLKSELPQLIALRVPFYDPSFEALVKIQLRFCTEGYSRLAQIQQYLDPASRDEYANGVLDSKIDDMLVQMQGLSITSLKQFNSLFLYGVEKTQSSSVVCTGKYVTKVVLKAENVLDLEYLKKVEEIKQRLEPYCNCVVSPAVQFVSKKSLIRYFNEMNILLAYLFLDNITYSNHFIQSAKTLKIYLIHDGEVPVEGISENAAHFIEYYSIQAGLSKVKYFFLASEIAVFSTIACYILYIYLVLANSHKVKSNNRVMFRWLGTVFLCCLASSSLITYREGATSWNLIFEPSTTFTKAAYFLIVIVLGSRNLFDSLVIPGPQLHKRLLQYYTGFYGVPSISKNLFINLGIVSAVQVACLALVAICFRGEFYKFIYYRLVVVYEELILAIVLQFFSELTIGVGIIVNDSKKVSLDLEDSKGANFISSKLMQYDQHSLKYRLGLKLLTVPKNSNVYVMASLGLILKLVILAHWTLVMPQDMNIEITNSNTWLYYLEYSLLVIFIAAISALITPCANTEQLDFSENVKHFNSIELKSSSDVLRIASNQKTSHIVTTLLNHKVMYWSPLSDPEPIELLCNLWPINHVDINDDGNFVILINFKDGIVKCYDRQERQVKWMTVDDSLTNRPKILESFFRKRTVPGFLARKMLRKRRGSDASLSSVNSQVNANFPPPIQMKSFSQEQRERKEFLSKEEYVMVLQSGEILVVSCSDGTIKRYDVNQPLINARKIRTARVPDRIVCLTESTELVVVNIVNNVLKFKNLKIKRINPPSSLASELNPPAIYTVEFVGFIVKVDGLECQIIDSISGNIVKQFAIGSMRPNSLKVSYPEPSHCRFCGSAAISSFSIMYENEGGEDGVVVVHTFKVDEMRKAICLRVERDPREIRCLGFSAADEHVNWYYNIIGYEATNVNSMIGIVETDEKEQEYKGNTDSVGLTSLRNRKKTKRGKKSYQVIVVSFATGDADYYPMDEKMGNIWSVTRYGYKSVIVNLGDRLEIIYF
ncbi:hypothetical protein G210_2243, partial [Candida maltosa Xu316]